jgi:hypothetical protein
MLTFAFVQSAIDMYDVDYGYTVLLGIGGTFVVGIGALLVGVVLMFVWYLFPRSKPFFSGRASTARPRHGARRARRLRPVDRRRDLSPLPKGASPGGWRMTSTHPSRAGSGIGRLVAERLAARGTDSSSSCATPSAPTTSPGLPGQPRSSPTSPPDALAAAVQDAVAADALDS